MHKLIARVKVHAARTQRQRRLVQLAQRNTGKTYVNGAAFHVQTVLGHAAAACLAQVGVGGGTAVTGDDFK
jgi:hypothetical protein